MTKISKKGKMKAVKAWAIYYQDRPLLMFDTFLIYQERFKAIARIKGSPIMSRENFKVIPVLVSPIKRRKK